MSAQCDIAIIGGGPVGSALALALRDSHLDVRIFEARKAQHASTDPRGLALSYGSRLLLNRLGVWDGLTHVSTIKTIHVSQKNHFGRTLLRASELNVPDLGYVLPFSTLQAQLETALQHSNATCLSGVTVTQLHSNAENTTLLYRQGEEEHTLHARLAVVADGGKLLEATHPPQIHDYGQSAVIAHVTCTHPQPETAFERFTTHGPVALLPYNGGYELIWTVEHEATQTMLQWDDAAFVEQLHQHFGDRVGEFLTAGKRNSFPLRLKRAPQITLPHTVLIGNAAQTLHPVAGQGFNMGLRDAWELAQTILDTEPHLLGSDEMLRSYRQMRRLDRSAGSRFTDGLVRLFSNDLPLLKAGRGISLSLLDCLPGAKKYVARRMMFGAQG